MCTNPSTADPILSAIPGTQVLDPASTTLLASPIAIAIVHTGLRLLVYLSHIQLVQRSRRLSMLFFQRSFVSCFGGVGDAHYATEDALQRGWPTRDE